MNKALLSSEKMDWATPLEFFDKLNQEFSFDLDAAASAENTKCARYFSIEDDGLAQSWRDLRIFCNPPYGRTIGRWVKKALDETTIGQCPLAVLLVPARTDTKWFHEYILGKAEIRFLRGRLRFGDGAKDAPFPSMVAIFRSKEVN